MSDMISRQAVLKLLSTMPPEEVTTKAMLIQNVKYMSAAQPEKRTEERAETHACDLIDREAAVDAIYHHLPSVSRTRARTMLHEVPSAQPEQKRGRWIYGEDNLGTGRDGWFCSECGHFEMWDYSADMKSAELNLPNYCPNCGADMRGEKDG